MSWSGVGYQFEVRVKGRVDSVDFDTFNSNICSYLKTFGLVVSSY